MTLHEIIREIAAEVPLKQAMTREVVWRSPASRRVRVTSQRLVSFTQRAVVAIRYEVEPLDEPADIVVQSELVANEPPPPGLHDPRTAAVLASPLSPELHEPYDGRIVELLARSEEPQYQQRRVQVGFAVDDIREVAAALESRGVERISEIEGGPDSGQLWCYFKDPEGNVFEIAQRL